MWPTYDAAMADLAKMEDELFALAERTGEVGYIGFDYDGLIAVPFRDDSAGYHVFYGRVLNIARVAGFSQAADLWLQEWGHIDRVTRRVMQREDEG